MIDISKPKIEITCPSCDQQIALKDKDDSAKKSIQDINKSFKDWDNLFKDSGKK